MPTCCAEAQAKGFAEADPTADVDGLDAAAKIAILASIAFNSRVTIDDVHAEGIRNVTPLDLEIAKDMGYCVKLLAHAHRTEEGIDVRVHPTMLPLSHQLATVNGVYNAIYVVGDAVGETMFFGEGAGSGPAASAVMGDVLEVARHLQAGIPPFVGCTCTDKLPLVPMEELKTKYYIRFAVADRSGVLAAMAGVFAQPRRERALGHPARQEGRRLAWTSRTSPTPPARRACAPCSPTSPSSTTCCARSRASSAWRISGVRAKQPAKPKVCTRAGSAKAGPACVGRRRFAADFSVVNLVIPDRR